MPGVTRAQVTSCDVVTLLRRVAQDVRLSDELYHAVEDSILEWWQMLVGDTPQEPGPPEEVR